MCLNFCQSMYCITFDFFRSGKKRTKVIIWLMEREKRDKKCEKNVSIFFPFPSDPTKATTFILTSHGKLIMNKLPLVAKLSSHFSNFFILPPSSSTSSGQWPKCVWCNHKNEKKSTKVYFTFARQVTCMSSDWILLFHFLRLSNCDFEIDYTETESNVSTGVDCWVWSSIFKGSFLKCFPICHSSLHQRLLKNRIYLMFLMWIWHFGCEHFQSKLSQRIWVKAKLQNFSLSQSQLESLWVSNWNWNWKWNWRRKTGKVARVEEMWPRMAKVTGKCLLEWIKCHPNLSLASVWPGWRMRMSVYSSEEHFCKSLAKAE